MSAEKGVALFVADIFRVLGAIGFDDQAMLETYKIGNIGRDWRLPPKLEHGQAAIAQDAPKRGLGFGRLAPHGFCQLARSRRDLMLRHVASLVVALSRLATPHPALRATFSRKGRREAPPHSSTGSGFLHRSTGFLAAAVSSSRRRGA